MVWIPPYITTQDELSSAFNPSDIPVQPPPSVALIVITDGRFQYLYDTLDSASSMVAWPFDHRIMINDSADTTYAERIENEFPDFTFIHHETRRGFCGAVASGWEAIRKVQPDYVFWLEGDFTFNAPINLADLMSVLRTHSYLSQIVLLRQPWSNEEKAVGGIIQKNPTAYKQKAWNGLRWIEHREFYSTNPALIPWATFEYDWPEAPFCEGKFGFVLNEDEGNRFAYWGSKKDPPLIHHIGETRVGTGY